MNDCKPKFPCCPPETANVVQVQTVDGIKGLNNCFVYVQSNNTSYYVDNAHHITPISSNTVEVNNYDTATNPLNLRNQTAYDTGTKTLYYFTNSGQAISFGTSITPEDIAALSQAIAGNTSAIDSINTRLNQEVEQSTKFMSNTSTVTVEHTKVNLANNAMNTVSEALPVASETQAGVMNTAAYSAIQTNAENVDAILNGAVALNGIVATPTQAQLTTAWQTATGRTTLTNRASIFDVTNQRLWYYYDNVDTWYIVGVTGEGGGEVTINQATNTSLGIVKGSTNEGQNFVEPDGSLSLNGWDETQQNITNISNKLNDTANQLKEVQDEIATLGNKLYTVTTTYSGGSLVGTIVAPELGDTPVEGMRLTVKMNSLQNYNYLSLKLRLNTGEATQVYTRQLGSGASTDYLHFKPVYDGIYELLFTELGWTAQGVHNAIGPGNILWGSISLENVHTVGSLKSLSVPVYEKTITFTPTFSTNTVSAAHGISGLNTVISATGAVALSNGSNYILGGHNSNDAGESIWTVDDTNVTLVRSGDFTVTSGRPHYITIRYTQSSL